MIGLSDASLAMLARAKTAVLPTTGTMALAATATGYSRLAGSFLTDGFRPGMEFTPAGFGSNVADLITSVASDGFSLTTKTAHAVEASAAGRSLTVGVPPVASENEQFTKPAGGKPYIEEEFVPATNLQKTLPADGGETEENGLYILKVYGPSKYGRLGLNAYVDAIKARFTFGTPITTSDGDVLKVGTGSTGTPAGATSGQLIPLDNAWAVIRISVPWWCRTTNLVAA